MSISSAGGAFSSPACSSRIPIVPVRYAVLPGNPGAKPYAYAGSGYALDQGLPALKEATYTLRSLRPGYVYVYMKGPQGEKLVIHEYDGQGKYRELTYTGLENYHKRNAYREGGSSYWVWADTCPDTAKEVWIGYSTHLWTNAITGKVMASASWRKRLMQPLDMHELTNGEKTPSKQKHVLPASALSTWVEDYKPKSQRVPLAWSACFSTEELPLQIILAQAANYPHTQPRVPVAVALYDAEGLTLGLGLTVAARQHQALDLKNTLLAGSTQAASSQLPACMRLDVEKVQPESADFHRKSVVAFLLDQALRGMYKASSIPANREPDALAKLRGEGHRAQPYGRRIPSDSELKFEVLTDKNLSPDGWRFATRMNQELYKQFLAERDSADQRLMTLLERLAVACANHDAWLATAEIGNLEKSYSLAAAFSSYDRDHKVSAQGLEQTIASCMHNMGNCSLGQDGQDPRYKRLESWVDDKASPIYMGLAAYNPFRLAVEQFKKKDDLKGTLLSASATVINELGAKFEEVNGATDLIAETTTTVLMKRLKGQARWDKSRNLRQRVQVAANEAQMEDILGLLRTRYRLTDQLHGNEARLTEDVQALIDTGMARIVESKAIGVETGSRTVTLTETRTVVVRPTLAGWGKTGTPGALNFAVLYFNYVNLMAAQKEISSHYSSENATNLASAIMGFLGSLGSAMVSARVIQVGILSTIATRLPGVGYQLAVKSFLSSVAFTRWTGYPAILAGLATDIQKGARLDGAGNAAAATYTYAGGTVMVFGGIALTEGLIGFAGGAAFIPVFGWGAAALALVGLALICTAQWFYGKAEAENHRPMELWVTRSVFGNRMGDDSSRYEPDHRPQAFKGLGEELQGWYQANFGPVLLNADAAKQLGWAGVDSVWEHNWLEANTAEFTILLPGFIMNQSRWDYEIGVPPRSSERLPLAIYSDALPSTRITPHGLLVHYRRASTIGNNMQFRLSYRPNQGLSETTEVTASFVLGG